MNKHISNLKSVTRTDSNFDISSYCKLTKTTTKITEVSETATGGVLQRKMFLKILQNLQEFTTLLRLWLSCLLVNFAKFLRTFIMELPWTNSMREKCSHSEFFWSVFSYSVRMWKNTDQKTPNTDTFHAV